MLRIGTRGSKLALAQSHWVRDQILERFPETPISINVIKTSADWDTQTPIRAGSSRGVFVTEIEESLIAKEIDLAIHSMKDLPTQIPDALEISIIPVREDARDALLANTRAQNLQGLPEGALVGTGSVRRQAQILAARPDLRVADIRGNVDTRLQKLQTGKYDAIILACAGLNRLGLQDRISLRLELTEMLPAPGQGALALETRKSDERVCKIISFLNHAPTATAVLAERAFLRHMRGGCNSPIAVHAVMKNGLLKIEGLVAAPDGSKVIRESVEEKPDRADEVAAYLADKILRMGGQTILHSLH